MQASECCENSLYFFATYQGNLYGPMESQNPIWPVCCKNTMILSVPGRYEPGLDPDRLVFIDETWAKTNMARTHGWAPRGERLRMAVPHGHWNTTTFLAGLTRHGMISPFVINGAIDRDAFEAYVKEGLVPELRPGDIVVMDNLSSHKGPKVRKMIEAKSSGL